MKNTENRLYSNKDNPERVILIGIDQSSSAAGGEAENSLRELADLTETAGAEVLFYVLQNRDHPHPATYIGTGKAAELKQLIETLGATGIVCDDELTPVQMKNLTDILDTKVMDRTLIILDIFAQRACSGEGKLQVELAQLKYTASHLAGMHRYLSRQGGGIGTRGPGEKKIETDRRLISRQISSLKAETSEIKNHRDTQRKKRSSSGIPVGAIVGYTNAGKSSLINRLTDAGVLEENKLFATLDPTTRILKLNNGQEVLLTDTVGFIRKLPHNLIDAFRSTLEEALYADFLIHVVDASDPQRFRHMQITYDTLEDLGIKSKPVITIFNKMDLAEISGDDAEPLNDPRSSKVIRTSVKTQDDLSAVTEAIEEILREDKVYVERLYSYADAGRLQLLRRYGELITEKYTDNGIYIEAYIPKRLL